MEQQLNRACERTQNINKTKSLHIQIDRVIYWSIPPTNNAMVLLKDDFIVWRQSWKEDFLSTIY